MLFGSLLVAPLLSQCRFKTACRSLGLPNWPYRRRKSVQTLLDNIAGEDEAGEVVKILKAEDEALLKEPSKRLCRNFKRLRQAFYKEKYREKSSNKQDQGITSPNPNPDKDL